MLREITALATGLVLAVSTTWAQKAGTTYGASPRMKRAVPLESAVASKPKSGTAIQGVVTDVCSKKGCWMIIKSGNMTARVTFKDYAFFVPTSLKGRTVSVEGVLTVEELTEDEARHYAEDAGSSKEEVAAITGSQKEYSIEASSVTVR
jgi:Domain of unknown function (DUF4920)